MLRVQTVAGAGVLRAAGRSRRMSVTVRERGCSDMFRRESPDVATHSTRSHAERALTAAPRRTGRATVADASPAHPPDLHTAPARTD